MIQIYSKPHCKYCIAAKSLLAQKCIDYKEYRIGEHISREDFLQLYPEAKTVPVIVVNNKWIGGFKELNEYVETNYGNSNEN